LAEVAQSDESWIHRLRALDARVDQVEVLALAREAPAEEIRLAAVNMLTDQDALGEIARGSDTEAVRVAAVRSSPVSSSS